MCRCKPKGSHICVMIERSSSKLYLASDKPAIHPKAATKVKAVSDTAVIAIAAAKLVIPETYAPHI